MRLKHGGVRTLEAPLPQCLPAAAFSLSLSLSWSQFGILAPAIGSLPTPFSSSWMRTSDSCLVAADEEPVPTTCVLCHLRGDADCVGVSCRVFPLPETPHLPHLLLLLFATFPRAPHSLSLSSHSAFAQLSLRLSPSGYPLPSVSGFIMHRGLAHSHTAALFPESFNMDPDRTDRLRVHFD